MNRLPVILLLILSQAALAQWDDTDVLSPEFHAGRREALRALLPNKSAAVFFSNPVRNRSNDVDYDYHQNPDFYYLTGYLEPDALIIIYKEEQNFGSFKSREILFVQERNLNSEVWTGKRLGKEGAAEKLRIQKTIDNSEFRYAELNLNDLEYLFIQWPEDPNSSNGEKADLKKLVESLKDRIASLKIKSSASDLKGMMARLREIKQQEELVLLRKAINITCDGFVEMIKSVRPGMKEYQTQAKGEYVFRDKGAEDKGYGSICGGGHNACVLHYVFNRKELSGDDLFLVDMGAEYHGYTADVTRTFPVDGKFSEEERAIYQLVLDAQNAGIAACKPGNTFRSTHEAAYDVIAKGLIRLGITKTEEEARLYFMHGTSHYLGLDVHDAGTFGPLQENSVITVEPGIYISENSPCDKKWWNKGVRIEDDVLITANGHEVLSGHLVRSIDAIEKLMANPQ